PSVPTPIQSHHVTPASMLVQIPTQPDECVLSVADSSHDPGSSSPSAHHFARIVVPVRWSRTRYQVLRSIATVLSSWCTIIAAPLSYSASRLTLVERLPCTVR